MKSSLCQGRVLVHNPPHLGGRNKFLSATIGKAKTQLTVSLFSLIIQNKLYLGQKEKKKKINTKEMKKILVHYEFFRFTQGSE